MEDNSITFPVTAIIEVFCAQVKFIKVLPVGEFLQHKLICAFPEKWLLHLQKKPYCVTSQPSVFSVLLAANCLTCARSESAVGKFHNGLVSSHNQTMVSSF